MIDFKTEEEKYLRRKSAEEIWEHKILTALIMYDVASLYSLSW